MTVENVENTKYPYRLPVFELDNQGNYSKVVLDTITVDDNRNNITHNNNSLMFLRKKKTVQNIKEGKELVEDVEDLNPTVTKPETTEESGGDNSSSSSADTTAQVVINAPEHFEPKYVVDSETLEVKTFNTDKEYELRYYDDNVEVSYDNSASTFEEPVEIIATRGNVVNLYIDKDKTTEPVELKNVANAYAEPNFVVYKDNNDELTDQIIVKGGYKRDGGKIFPDMEPANGIYYNPQNEIKLSNSSIKNTSVTGFIKVERAEDSKSDGNFQTIVPQATIEITNQSVAPNPFDDSSIELNFKATVSGQDGYGALIVADKELHSDKSIKLKVDNIDQTINNMIGFSHEDSIKSKVTKLTVTNVSNATPGTPKEDSGNPPTSSPITVEPTIVEPFEIAEAPEVAQGTIGQFVNAVVDPIDMEPEYVEEEFNLKRPYKEEYDDSPYTAVDSFRLGSDDERDVWDSASTADVNILKSMEEIHFAPHVVSVDWGAAIPNGSYPAVKRIVYHNAITSIKGCADWNTTFPNLETLVFDTIKGIEGAHMYINNLKEVIISSNAISPDPSTTTHKGWVIDCPNLKYLILPDIEDFEIPPRAFLNNGLKNVIFPRKMKSIGYMAFQGNDLEAISLPQIVERIELDAFTNNPNFKFKDPVLVLPETDSFDEAFDGSAFENVIKVVIPFNAKNINKKMFEYMPKLKVVENWGNSINIPELKNSIPANAEIICAVDDLHVSEYYKTALTSTNSMSKLYVQNSKALPTSVNPNNFTNITEIEMWNFRSDVDNQMAQIRIPKCICDMPNLQTLRLPSNVTTLDGPIFYDQDDSENVDFKITPSFEIILPPCLRTIFDNPFKNLTKIPAIPECVYQVNGTLYDGNFDGEVLQLPLYLKIILKSQMDLDGPLIKNCPNVKKVILGSKIEPQGYDMMDLCSSNMYIEELQCPQELLNYDLTQVFTQSSLERIDEISFNVLYDQKTLNGSGNSPDFTEISLDNALVLSNMVLDINITAYKITYLKGEYLSMFNIRSINVPLSVTEMDYNIFENSKALREFTFTPHIWAKLVARDSSSNVENRLFYGCDSLEIIRVPYIMVSHDNGDIKSQIFDFNYRRPLSVIPYCSLLCWDAELDSDDNGVLEAEKFMSYGLSFSYGEQYTDIVLDPESGGCMIGGSSEVATNIFRATFNGSEDNITINPDIYPEVYKNIAIDEKITSIVNRDGNAYCLLGNDNGYGIEYVFPHTGFQDGQLIGSGAPETLTKLTINNYSYIEDYPVTLPNLRTLEFIPDSSLHFSNFNIEGLTEQQLGEIVIPITSNLVWNGIPPEILERADKVVFEIHEEGYEHYLEMSNYTTNPGYYVEIQMPYTLANQPSFRDYATAVNNANADIEIVSYVDWDGQGFEGTAEEMCINRVNFKMRGILPDENTFEKLNLTKNVIPCDVVLGRNALRSPVEPDFFGGTPYHHRRWGAYLEFEYGTQEIFPCFVTPSRSIETIAAEANGNYDNLAYDQIVIPSSVTTILPSTFDMVFTKSLRMTDNTLTSYYRGSLPHVKDSGNWSPLVERVPNNITVINGDDYGIQSSDYTSPSFPKEYAIFPEKARIYSESIDDGYDIRTVVFRGFNANRIHLPNQIISPKNERYSSSSIYNDMKGIYINLNVEDVHCSFINIPNNAKEFVIPSSPSNVSLEQFSCGYSIEKFIVAPGAHSVFTNTLFSIPTHVNIFELCDENVLNVNEHSIIQSNCDLNLAQRVAIVYQIYNDYHGLVKSDANRIYYKIEDDTTAMKIIATDAFVRTNRLKWVHLDLPNLTTISSGAFKETNPLFISWFSLSDPVLSDDWSDTKHTVMYNVFTPSGEYDPDSFLIPHLKGTDGVLTLEQIVEYCSNHPDIEVITIAKGVTKIVTGEILPSDDRCPFAGCSNVKRINFPDTLVDISECTYLFGNLTTLEKINMSPNITEIPPFLCENCSSLKSLTIPDKVTLIKTTPILGCSSLENFYIGNSVQRAVDRLFENGEAKLDTYYVPSSVTSLASGNGRWPFGYSIQPNIKYIYFENTDDSVLPERPNSYSFKEYFPNLEKIKCPPALANSLLSEYIGRDVVYEPLMIVDNQYDGRLDIGPKFTIPTTVTSIGSCAFKNCTNLKELYIHGNVTSVGSKICERAGVERIYVEDSASGFAVDWASGNGNIKELQVNQDILQHKNGNSYVNLPSQPTKIVCAETIDTIPDKAFVNSYSLKELKLPNQVTVFPDTMIGDYCTALEKVEWPDAVQELKYSPINSGFYEGDVFVLPDSVTKLGRYALDGLSATKIVITKNVKEFEYNAYSIGNCSELRELIIEEGCTASSTYLPFTDCPKLEKLYIPDTFGSITFPCSSPLINYSMLKEVHLPSTMTHLRALQGDYSEGGLFENCISLESIELPPQLTHIPPKMFKGCVKLNSIIIPETVRAIEEQAFYGCTAITGLIIPSKVTEFGDECFVGCNVKNLSVNQTFCNLAAKKSFITTTTVDKIIVQEGVTALREFCFTDFINVKSIKLPNSLKTLAANSLRSLVLLNSLDLPDNLEVIGDYAINDCLMLSELYLPPTVKSIGYFAFSNAPIKNLEIPTALDKLGKYSLSSIGLTGIHIPSNITIIEEEALADNDLVTLVIPENVKKIESRALAKNTKLTKFMCYWNQIKETGYVNVFGGTGSVEELYLVITEDTTIPAYAFATEELDNASLKRVYFINRKHYKLEIDYHAYDNCTAIENPDIKQMSNNKFVQQLLDSNVSPKYSAIVEGTIEIASSGSIFDNPDTHLNFQPTVYLPGQHQIMTLKPETEEGPSLYYNRAVAPSVGFTVKEMNIRAVEEYSNGSITQMYFSKDPEDKITVLNSFNNCFGLKYRLPQSFPNELSEIKKVFAGAGLKLYKKISNNGVDEFYSFAEILLSFNLEDSSDVATCCDWDVENDPSDSSYRIYTMRVGAIKKILKYKGSSIIADDTSTNRRIDVYDTYIDEGSQKGLPIPEATIAQNNYGNLKSQAALLQMFEQIPYGYIQPSVYLKVEGELMKITTDQYNRYTYNIGGINSLNCRQYVSYPNSLPYNQELAYKGIDPTNVDDAFIGALMLADCIHCGIKEAGCCQNGVTNYRDESKNDTQYEIYKFSGYEESGDMTIDKGDMNNTPIYVSTMMPASKNSQGTIQESTLLEGSINFVSTDGSVLQETQYNIVKDKETGESSVQLLIISGDKQYTFTYPYQEIELASRNEYKYADYSAIKRFNNLECIKYNSVFNQEKVPTFEYQKMSQYSSGSSIDNKVLYIPGTIEDVTPEQYSEQTAPFIVLSPTQVLSINPNSFTVYYVNLQTATTLVDTNQGYSYGGELSRYESISSVPENMLIGYYPPQSETNTNISEDLGNDLTVPRISNDSTIDKDPYSKGESGKPMFSTSIYKYNPWEQVDVRDVKDMDFEDVKREFNEPIINNRDIDLPVIINKTTNTSFINGKATTNSEEALFVGSTVNVVVDGQKEFLNTYTLPEATIYYNEDIVGGTEQHYSGNATLLELEATTMKDGQTLYTYAYNSRKESENQTTTRIEHNLFNGCSLSVPEFKSLKTVRPSRTIVRDQYIVKKTLYGIVTSKTEYQSNPLTENVVAKDLLLQTIAIEEQPDLKVKNTKVTEEAGDTIIIEREYTEVLSKSIIRITAFEHKSQRYTTLRNETVPVYNIVNGDVTRYDMESKEIQVGAEYTYLITLKSDEYTFANDRDYTVCSFKYTPDEFCNRFVLCEDCEVIRNTQETNLIVDNQEKSIEHLFKIYKKKDNQLQHAQFSIALDDVVESDNKMKGIFNFSNSRIMITEDMTRIYSVEREVYGGTTYYPTTNSVIPVVEKSNLTEPVVYPGVPNRKYITFYIPNYIDPTKLKGDSFEVVSERITAIFQSQTFETGTTNIGTVRVIGDEDPEERQITRTQESKNDNTINEYKLDTFFIPPGNYKSAEELVDSINETVYKSLRAGDENNGTKITSVTLKNTIKLNLNSPKILISTDINENTFNILVDWEDFDFKNFKVHLKKGKKYICILDSIMICQFADDVKFDFEFELREYIFENNMVIQCSIGNCYQIEFSDVITSDLITDSMFYDLLINNKKFIEIANNRNLYEFKFLDKIIPVRFDQEDVPEKIDYLCLVEPNQNFQQEFNTFSKLQTFEDIPNVSNEFGNEFKQYIKAYFENENFGIAFKHNIKNVWNKLGIQPIIVDKDMRPYILGPNNILKVLKSGLNIEFNKIIYYNILSSDFVETSYMTDKFKLPHLLYMNVNGKKKLYRGEQSMNNLDLFNDVWKGEHLPNLDIPDRILIKTTTNEDIEYILNIGDNETIISETDNFVEKNGKLIIKVYQTIDISKSEKIYIYIDSEEHYPFVTGVNAKMKIEWIK